ncbi:MAG: hypothetical protein OSA40_04200 [Phycisphaerales bacterium]|nr:hypothetical protein [Phycisphaerales bacterium]
MMRDAGNAAISDSGNDAMLAGVVEKWPVDPRKAGDAVLQYRTMPLFTIALKGVAGLILLTLAIITIFGAWNSLGLPEAHPAFGYILLVVAAIIPFELGRQFRVRRRMRWVTLALSEHGTSTCPQCGTVPFEAASCCRLAPEGWSRLDLYGFWHEIGAKRRDPPVGGTRTLRDLGITTRRSRSEAERTKEAWQRGRGRLGTSLKQPLAKPGQQSIRLILGWWKALWPLLFVPIAVVAVVPLVTRGGPIGAGSLVFPGLIGIAAIWGIRESIKRLRSIPRAGGRTLPRCAGCGYRLHPPFPDRCPECGENLDEPEAVSLLPQPRDE